MTSLRTVAPVCVGRRRRRISRVEQSLEPLVGEELRERLLAECPSARARRAAPAASHRTPAAPARGDSRASSAWSISDCLSFGLVIWSVDASTVSRSPNVWISWRRGLRADAGHARHVVDAVAHQREHVADLLRRHAELLEHLARADAPVVHRVEHVDPGSSSISCIRSLSELTIVTFQPGLVAAVT